MTPEISFATAADLGAISTFTQDTFSWGDYVSESFPMWLEDESSRVLVATVDETAVALTRIVRLSDHEAWIHAARVHPSHRRLGLGSALNDAACDWARQAGVRVARLMVETWNTGAGVQVESLGFRPVVQWLSAVLDMGAELQPLTNGGRRVPGDERLSRGRSSEADMAWMAWASSDLAAAARELIPRRWWFRRARPDDLALAAAEGRLWHCPSGWASIEIDDQGSMTVEWLASSDLDFSRIVRAIVDLGDGSRVGQLRIMVPAMPWTESTLTSLGFVLQPSHIYMKPL
jgi:GNAT superfamily N-acetyltransferase